MAVDFVFVLLLFLQPIPQCNSSPKTDDISTSIDYKTYFFQQKIDHFGFANNEVFSQRYLLADQYWDKTRSGPIFFYTGNEGAIDWFCNNTGLMWEWASEFKAMLVFAEHRYYGESMPYGNQSYEDPLHLNFLTAEQALADFVLLIEHIKLTVPGAADSPVLGFGGSYGGMLAAWLRMKYPHAVIGSLAASAPIWQFGDLVECGTFQRIVTNDFKSSGPNCADNIAKSWKVIDKFAETGEGRLFLQHTLGLCEPVNASAPVKGWLAETWGNLAMVDYPYKANFLMPLPAWPIKVVCKALSDPSLSDEALVRALTQAVNVYYNFTGSAPCFNTSTQATSALGDQGWDVQACTEMIMPMCSDGIHDMFEPSPWHVQARVAECKAQYGLTPRPQWIIEQFGGKNISAHSNIIFSNGRLDPWSGGGVMESISDSLVAIVIDEGAHHLDLRSSHPGDPQSVREARIKEKTLISGWIKQYWHQSSEIAKEDERRDKDTSTRGQDSVGRSGVSVWLVVLSAVLVLIIVAAVILTVRSSRVHTWLRGRTMRSSAQDSTLTDQYKPLI